MNKPSLAFRMLVIPMFIIFALFAQSLSAQCPAIIQNSNTNCQRDLDFKLVFGAGSLPNGPWVIELIFDDDYYDIIQEDGETVEDINFLDAFLTPKQITSYPAFGGDDGGAVVLNVRLRKANINGSGTNCLYYKIIQDDAEVCSGHKCFNSIEVGQFSNTTLLSNLIAPNGPLLDPASASTQSQSVFVKGQVIVDVDYMFHDSELTMDSGAEIVVNGNVDFRIRNSSLSGCSEMWKGITVREFGEFRLFNSIISDAYKGVSLIDGARFGARRVEYVNNIYGIYFEDVVSNDPRDQSNTQIVEWTSEYQGNTLTQVHFYGQGKTLKPYQGQPEWHIRPYAGILVHDMDQLKLVGRRGSVYSLFANNFFNMYNGIIAFNSTLILERNMFKNIYKLDGYRRISGNGIYLYGELEGSLDIVGTVRNNTLHELESGSSGDFVNCHTAINATRSILNIEDVIIRHGTYGIISNQGQGVSRIKNNLISTNFRGIQIDNSHQIGIVVEDNLLTQKDESITVFTPNFLLTTSNYWSLSGADIVNNEFRPKGNGALYIGSSFYVNTYENDIISFARENSFNLGLVVLNGGALNNFECNAIDYDEYNHYMSGLAILGSRQNRISCNFIGATYDAVRVNGMSDGSMLLGNNLTGRRDLIYGNPGVGLAWTGDQPMDLSRDNNGNLFRGSGVEGIQAVHHSSDPDVIERSEFFVEPSDALQFPRHNQGDRWFINRNEDFFGCAVNDACTPGIDGLIPVLGSDFYQKLRDGNFYKGEHQEVVLRTGQAHLYDLLDQMDELPKDYADFYIKTKAGPIGHFADIRHRLQYIYLDDQSNMDILRQLYQKRRAAYTDWRLAFDDENIKNQNQLSDEIGKLQIEINERQYTIWKQHDERMNQIKSALKSVKVNSEVDRNEVTYLSLYMDYLDGVVLDKNNFDYDVLTDLAFTCSLEGGDAVLRARSLWLSLNEGIDKLPIDANLCPNLSKPSLGQISSTAKAANTIYPNPANDEMFLANPDIEQVRIVDPSGKVVLTHTSRAQVIQISSLPPGIYFVEITSSLGHTNIHKLSIIR